MRIRDGSTITRAVRLIPRSAQFCVGWEANFLLEVIQPKQRKRIQQGKKMLVTVAAHDTTATLGIEVIGALAVAANMSEWRGPAVPAVETPS